VHPFWLPHEENKACLRPSQEGTAMAKLKLHGSLPGEGGEGKGIGRGGRLGVRLGGAPWWATRGG
jgi:hypothetical protein